MCGDNNKNDNNNNNSPEDDDDDASESQTQNADTVVDRQSIRNQTQLSKSTPCSPTSCKLVIQRIDKACILTDNDCLWEEVGGGYAVYVSFMRTVTTDILDKAVKVMFSLRHLIAPPSVMTMGSVKDAQHRKCGEADKKCDMSLHADEQWSVNDGSSGPQSSGTQTRSVSATYSMADFPAAVSVLVIPQITLGAKLKGTTLQYHGLISKPEGEKFYSSFVAKIREAASSVKNKSVTVVAGTYGNRQGLRLETSGPSTILLEL